MKAFLFTTLILASSFAQAKVTFSGASPLNSDLKNKITRTLERRCNIQGFSVVESRTLVNAASTPQDVTYKYFTTFAVLTFGGAPTSQIEVNSQSLKTKGSPSTTTNTVVSINGALCNKHIIID